MVVTSAVAMSCVLPAACKRRPQNRPLPQRGYAEVMCEELSEKPLHRIEPLTGLSVIESSEISLSQVKSKAVQQIATMLRQNN